MITENQLLDIDKETIPTIAAELRDDDVAVLAELLSSKEDNLRYNAFLLLQERAKINAKVCEDYFELFAQKLKNDNSYQRNIGVTMLAVCSRWCDAAALESVLKDYLNILNDEKPITVRQCIRGLQLIAENKPCFGGRIADTLLSFDVTRQRESMRKVILLDILFALASIRKIIADDRVDEYILKALQGGLLDRKSIEIVKKLI